MNKMPKHIAFDAAVLDETIYIVPDDAKLTISATNANDVSHLISPEVETVVVIMPYDKQQLTDKGKQATEKLIGALKLEPGKVALISLPENPRFSFRHMRHASQLKQVILLGCSLKRLGVHVDTLKYKPFIFNGLEIIISDSLEVISDTDKKVFWVRLQQMFKLI